MPLWHNRKPDPSEVPRDASKNRKVKRDTKAGKRTKNTVSEYRRMSREQRDKNGDK